MQPPQDQNSPDASKSLWPLPREKEQLLLPRRALHLHLLISIPSFSPAASNNFLPSFLPQSVTTTTTLRGRPGREFGPTVTQPVSIVELRIGTQAVVLVWHCVHRSTLALKARSDPPLTPQRHSGPSVPEGRVSLISWMATEACLGPGMALCPQMPGFGCPQSQGHHQTVPQHETVLGFTTLPQQRIRLHGPLRSVSRRSHSLAWFPPPRQPTAKCWCSAFLLTEQPNTTEGPVRLNAQCGSGTRRSWLDLAGA